MSAPGSLSDLESRGGGVAGMTTLGRCSWAAREKESHGLLPLYVALATKVPCAPGSCPPSISASPLSLARAAQTEAEREAAHNAATKAVQETRAWMEGDRRGRGGNSLRLALLDFLLASL